MRDPTKYCVLLSLLILFLPYQTSPQTNIQTEKNVYSQFNPPVFESITVEDGLPENSVHGILQDYLGYLWLGTQNGLVQYDGYSMKVFQPEKDNSGSISDADIITIYEDKNKTIWIGTWTGGLNKFDRANESFRSYRYDLDDTTSINSDQIHCIYEDKSGRFWVGTDEGLNFFNRKNEIFTRFYFRDGNSQSPGISESDYYKSNIINAIIEDPVSGDLLIGSNIDGLWKFSIKEKTFSKYKFNNESVSDKKTRMIQSFCKARDGKIWMISDYSLSSLDSQKRTFKSYIDPPIIVNANSEIFGSVIEDKDGLIWCGLLGGGTGLFCFNPETKNLEHYDLFREKPKQANFNNILSLYEDHSGIIWIGTWATGVKKLDKRKNEFQVLRSDPNLLSNSLSHSIVYSVIYDPKGFLWFCTKKGLDKYDLKTRTYKHYLTDEECITESFSFGMQDKSGYLWLGTANCGLLRFDPRDASYRFYCNDPKESLNLVGKQPGGAIIQDHLGILWIGTMGFGLYKYDIENNKLTHFKNDPNDPSSLSNDQINVIIEDSFGTIWVGTNLGGLNKFDRETEKFINCGFTSNEVIYEDRQKNFWVSDYLSGLNLFDREKGIVLSNYSKKDGLASNVIQGILEDDNDNLWICSENGLSKFNKRTKTFRNYYKEDGLPDNWFSWEQSGGKDPDGRMYFNNSGGEIVFHPDSITDDPIPPQVVLSRISLFNRPNEKLNYEGFISELKEITLPYDQNDLRFDFVGIHFSAPSRNRNKYILENFDNDWVDTGNQRYATYTNLDPGEYVFRATASNKDGIWNETGISITIIITPPWLATTWAYIFYILMIGSILYFTWKLQVKRIKVKHEFEMSRFETQKLHEVDEIKSRFFTNISHEFRTPLTLILGPVKQVIERTKEEKTRDDLKVVHKSANRLLGLVNQLLDISKLESGNMKLQTIPQNIIPLLKALVLSFTSYAERKRITLKFNSTEDEIIVYLDRDKVEKIITNVLSNAFKFTPDGGRIEVTVTLPTPSVPLPGGDNTLLKVPSFGGDSGVGPKSFTLARFVEVSIRDTGVGIPKEKMSKIFDRFYQVDGSHTREQEGTGIGLSLTKELVELHRGKIEVESEEGKGTTVIISIPLGKEHLKPEEISESEKDEEKVTFVPTESISFNETSTEKLDFDLIRETEKSLLLIVEDNSDVRRYIKDNLIKDYRILEAVDGEDGWNKSIEQIPDLIVSDVLMPKMDGFQLCEKLKTDERTSHIPVILLTAKAAKQDKIEGYEIGADDYIMKPFEPDELRARIKNLIEQRKRLHEHFQKRGIFDTEKSKIASVDKKFLQKTFEVIDSNISNTDLSVETIAESLAVSRYVLYKKLIALTGESPVEIIRRIRLNKAAVLIEKKFGNLSEIALEVGFNNPAYFSDCFRRQFGVAPSQYNRNNKIS
jgi:signal transduction histidine kinase/ligand-binding sensor domain-containing protein/DNA-binding response OmpR family regulator